MHSYEAVQLRGSLLYNDVLRLPAEKKIRLVYGQISASRKMMITKKPH